jgi:hypothetical protein
MTTLLRSIAQHPVVAFMGIGLAAGFLTAAIRPIADADGLPYGLPLHGFVGGLRVAELTEVTRSTLGGRVALPVPVPRLWQSADVGA